MSPALATILTGDVATAARRLVGATLTVDDVGGTIVETEAYDAADPASHSHRGPTARNATMFGPAGRAYVYRIYGLHHCLNVTCGAGAAVLIRAIAPTHNLEAMIVRRGVNDPRLLCAGPGRLCRALGIDLSFDGLQLDRAPITIDVAPAEVAITVGPRIGVSKGADTLWRFGLAGSRFLSRAFR